MLRVMLFVLILATASGSLAEQEIKRVPKELQDFNDRVLRQAAYQGNQWQELAKFDFYPREFYSPQVNLIEESAQDDVLPPSQTTSDESEGTVPPSKTKPYSGRDLQPRTSFTYACPTSIQCNDGGCCPVGDYCAIRDGSLGCCPIGSLCDASPIPSCTTSCYGVCCDVVYGLVGVPSCSPTPGAEGQSSGACVSSAPTASLSPGALCPASNFACGSECCLNGLGLVCDNITLPGQAFCNVPANVCPPGSKRVKREVNGTTTDDCLATTAPQLFSSRHTPTGSKASVAVVTATSGLFASTPTSSSAGSSATRTGSTSQSSSHSSGSNSASAASSSSAAYRNAHVDGLWVHVYTVTGALIVMAVGTLVVLL